jgi:hypothetical protein
MSDEFAPSFQDVLNENLGTVGLAAGLAVNRSVQNVQRDVGKFRRELGSLRGEMAAVRKQEEEEARNRETVFQLNVQIDEVVALGPSPAALLMIERLMGAFETLDFSSYAFRQLQDKQFWYATKNRLSEIKARLLDQLPEEAHSNLALLKIWHAFNQELRDYCQAAREVYTPLYALESARAEVSRTAIAYELKKRKYPLVVHKFFRQRDFAFTLLENHGEAGFLAPIEESYTKSEHVKRRLWVWWVLVAALPVAVFAPPLLLLLPLLVPLIIIRKKWSADVETHSMLLDNALGVYWKVKDEFDKSSKLNFDMFIEFDLDHDKRYEAISPDLREYLFNHSVPLPERLAKAAEIDSYVEALKAALEVSEDLLVAET